MASLSASSAIRGMCSQISTPLARVLIALNGPPNFVPGLGSKVSRWLGPPFIQSRMQALVFPERLAAAALACQAGMDAPRSAPRPPPRTARRERSEGESGGEGEWGPGQ